MVENIIIKSFKELDKAFEKNELAYLALTSKIELPIRDRWAYILYRNLIEDGVVVSREWKRTDIALLREQSPVALVELKAMYSFDALRPNISGFTNEMSKDEIKAKKLASSETEIYTVLLATHPEEVRPEYTEVIKYDAGINKAIRKYGSADKVRMEAISAVDNDLTSRNVVLFEELPGGEAFGVKTSVLCWVVKA